MKSSEQLVASIRELRFAIDRLTAAEIADAQPAVRRALDEQAKALQADVERLLEEMGAISQSEAFESDFVS